MTCAVLSIGSNVGDSLRYLRGVADALGDRLVVASSIYRTAPWGGVDQDPFYNAILIAGDNSVDPDGWLSFARDCEAAAERTREVRWGPRTLDVDVIAVYDEHGQLQQDDPELTLPHPRAHERAFVLAPWLEVQPHAVLPQGSVGELLAALQATGAPDQQLELVGGVSL